MHLVSGSLEERDHHSTYVAAVAGNEDLHRAPPVIRWLRCSRGLLTG